MRGYSSIPLHLHNHGCKNAAAACSFNWSYIAGQFSSVRSGSRFSSSLE